MLSLLSIQATLLILGLSVSDQIGSSYLDTNTMKVKSASLQDYFHQKLKTINDLSVPDENGFSENYIIGFDF